MVSRDQIMSWLEKTLSSDRFHDSCPNGLQVFGRSDINRIATCPSISEEAFLRAQEAQAQLLLVHHGLFWERSSRVIDPVLARRLKVLLQNDINLVAYHLPLDAHQQHGNNACLARALALNDLDWTFGHYQGECIGCIGILPQAQEVSRMAAVLGILLGGEPQVFGAAKREARRIGIVSGGAGDASFLLEARQRNVDVYVTGSMTEQGVAITRESGISVIAAGHYNTEKLGVRSLGEALSSSFGLEIIHLDVPNPV